MEQESHRLETLLDAAAFGEFSPADGTIEFLPPPPGPAMAVLGLTGRYVIATSARESWLGESLPAGDLLAPMSPRFLSALGREIGRRDDGVDVLLAARGLEGEAELVEVEREAHPRVARANTHRQDVRVFEDPSAAGIVILGHGLALRTEVAIEVQDPRAATDSLHGFCWKRGGWSVATKRCLPRQHPETRRPYEPF